LSDEQPSAPMRAQDRIGNFLTTEVKSASSRAGGILSHSRGGDVGLG